MKMIKINVIFVHGIELSTFTEKLREIGEGPKFTHDARWSLVQHR